MNNDTLAAFTAWGDRANRDTAHLLDIAIAGTIDQLIGHGTVTIKPHRLEEIVSRIGKRKRDEDGNWIVTLLPDPDENPDRNPAQTSDEIASLAGRCLNISEDDAANMTTGELVQLLHRLAGSALSQTRVDN